MGISNSRIGVGITKTTEVYPRDGRDISLAHMIWNTWLRSAA